MFKFKLQMLGFAVAIVVLTNLVLQGLIAYAHTGSPALTTYSNGQVLTAQSLNDNFAHVHNTWSGGIVNANISPSAAISYSKLSLANSVTNADVASGAAIAHSKLATPALVPKAWASITASCDSATTSTCAVAASSGVTSITTTSILGRYTVTLAYTAPDANYAAVVSGFTAGGCRATDRTGSTFIVLCQDAASTAISTVFDLVVLDNN